MRITEKELKELKIPFNYCLIKLPMSYSLAVKNHYEYKLGVSNIVIDTSFDPAYHAPRFGTLIKNPNSLIYKKGSIETMGWLTDIDTCEGDTVYFDYFSCLMALGKLANPVEVGENPNWYNCGDDLYVMLKYENLIFAERGNEIICLNGNVILRPTDKEIQSTLLLPDWLRKQDNKLICEVVHIGKPNREYLDGYIDADDVFVRDIVVIKNYKLKLENNIAFKQEKGLVFVQQKHLYLVLNR